VVLHSRDAALFDLFDFLPAARHDHGRRVLRFEEASETRTRHFCESAHSALGLFAPGQPFWFAAALAAFAGLCCLFRVDVHLGSIDGAPYDILCIPLQLLVAGLTVSPPAWTSFLWHGLSSNRPQRAATSTTWNCCRI